MKLDTLVFDIETQNFFTDPDVGWDNYAALKISVVGVYSYIEDRYYCYEENEMDKLAALFADARRIVGFSMNRYDIPVLNNYFQRLEERAAPVGDGARGPFGGDRDGDGLAHQFGPPRGREPRPE